MLTHKAEQAFKDADARYMNEQDGGEGVKLLIEESVLRQALDAIHYTILTGEGITELDEVFYPLRRTLDSAETVESLRVDAERYRWLRDDQNWPAVFDNALEPEPLRGGDLDAAIDAAMKEST